MLLALTQLLREFQGGSWVAFAVDGHDSPPQENKRIHFLQQGNLVWLEETLVTGVDLRTFAITGTLVAITDCVMLSMTEVTFELRFISNLQQILFHNNVPFLSPFHSIRTDI